MFGIGFPELIFILVVAALILGPEHMPKAARLIGRWSAKARSAATTLSSAVQEDEDLRVFSHDIHEIKTTLGNAKNELHAVEDALVSTAKTADEAFAETQKLIRESYEESRRDAALPAMENPLPSDNIQKNDSAMKKDDASSTKRFPPLSEFALTAIADQNASPKQTSCHERHVPLEQIRLLPGNVSHFVRRKGVALTAPDGKTCHFKAFPLPHVCHGTALCLSRRLAKPRADKTAFFRVIRMPVRKPAHPHASHAIFLSHS